MTKTLLLASVASLALACAPADDTEVDELEQSTQELTTNLGSGLNTGTRVSYANVVGAENGLVTSTGRLLTTGDNGLYEVTRSGSGITTTLLQAAQGCQFGGLTETRQTVYANCYGGNYSSESYVYAAPVGTLAFSKISTLKGRGKANGLGSDRAGNLYVATSFQNQIIRVPATSNPLVLQPFSLFLDNSGAGTNGLKYFAGTNSVYWSDVGVIWTVPLKADGTGDGTRKTQAAKYYNKGNPWDTTVFDDLTVDADGLLVCDFVRGAVRAFAFDGSQLGMTPPSLFNGLSSVTRLRGWGNYSSRALFVTERLSNRISVFEPGS